MLKALRAAAAGGGLLALLASAPEAPVDPAETIAAVAQREKSLKEMTFDIHVDVALKTPPWLHFTLQGKGRYERPGETTIHFDKVPWFGKGYETVSLESLDPKSWPAHYEIVSRHEGRRRHHADHARQDQEPAARDACHPRSADRRAGVLVEL